MPDSLDYRALGLLRLLAVAVGTRVGALRCVGAAEILVGDYAEVPATELQPDPGNE